MKSNNPSRRRFLKKAALATSILIVPRYVLGGRGFVAPSDRIGLGFIGCGKQTGGLQARFAEFTDTHIVAACDVYAEKLDRFVRVNNQFYAERSGQSSWNGTGAYEDYRELLARPDVDAVVIVTPDHWHAAQAVHAAEAGKDIYCEKPLSLTVREGRAMVDATRKHDRVFQTGNMQRSWHEFRQAVQLVRSGAIGAIREIVVSVGGPPVEWDLPAEPLPKGLNWDLWLGPNTVERPYNNAVAPAPDADFWARWRYYNEFGGGLVTDWGAHMFDICQWGLDMDHSGPVKVVPPGQGKREGLYFEYANGVRMVHRTDKGNYCHFFGTEGEVFVKRGEIRTTPASLADRVFAPDAYKIYVSEDHYRNFINAIRTRKRPICDVEIGHRTATVCNIANIGYAVQRPLTWSPEKERFKGDGEANRMLKRKMRKPWKV